MEYVQERVTTLHDFGDARPSAPTDEAAVVVPMTEREHAGLAAERVLSALETVDPGRVVVPLRASADRIDAVIEWLSEFDLSLEVLWCDGDRLGSLLSSAGLDGARGKGRDVWLAFGIAAQSEYVVVHDADAKTYDERHVPKLLFPLAQGMSFSKGYYARVENDRLYGRLFRLLYRPLIDALSRASEAAVLGFLGAFRYALAGEFALTGRTAERVRMQRGWGLEVGTLGEAFRLAGADGTAQVDLGVHEHDHRSVSGPSGLSEMSRQVAAALFRAVEENGLDPDYATVADRYRRGAERLVDAYALDAAFNGLEYDRSGEREQIGTYADAIEPPGADTRLPAWTNAAVTPEEVVDAAVSDLEAATSGRADDVAPLRSP
ncbi:glycosyl transferase family 2 [Natronomonas sp.]|uniref:glycosyl transferase family 2 n=1 Tax=Natronomonas sp. TaxID=2184060 RepID=UPI00263974BC|nr:glycosyl transferase family 2 [Natronomonas sp.]